MLKESKAPLIYLPNAWGSRPILTLFLVELRLDGLVPIGHGQLDDLGGGYARQCLLPRPDDLLLQQADAVVRRGEEIAAGRLALGRHVGAVRGDDRRPVEHAVGHVGQPLGLRARRVQLRCRDCRYLGAEIIFF